MHIYHHIYYLQKICCTYPWRDAGVGGPPSGDHSPPGSDLRPLHGQAGCSAWRCCLCEFSVSPEKAGRMWSSPPCAFLLLRTTAPQGLPALVCSLVSVSRFYVFYRALIAVFTGRVSPSHQLLHCGQSRDRTAVAASPQWLLAVRTRSSQAHTCSFFPSCTRHFLSSCFRPGTSLETSNIRVN